MRSWRQQRSGGITQGEQLLATCGGEKIIHVSVSIIRGNDVRSDYILLIADDVTDQRTADARIHHMAHYDNLTGLPNRALFNQRLKEALRHDLDSNQLTAVLCLDLDNFKNVNDALGHQVGDGLLRAVSRRLCSVVHEQDTLARLGGDEFSVVLPALDSATQAENLAQKLIDVIQPPFHIDGLALSVGLSVGIAIGASNMPRWMNCYGARIWHFIKASVTDVTGLSISPRQWARQPASGG